jgi:hypothetical protein
LKEGDEVAKERILTDKDFKKIKLQKLRQAAKKVDKKGFRSESESDEEMSGEEGEVELSEFGEEGEEDLSDAEFGESELSENGQNKRLAEKKYHEMHSSEDADELVMEEGESDMEEAEDDAAESGEFEWEEGESESLEESDEEAP